MPTPSVTTVTIDGNKFNALSAIVSLTAGDQAGVPQMGSLVCVDVVVDINDNQNVSFSRDKFKDITIEFCQDEHQQDAICWYAFKGRISHWRTGRDGNGNPTLSMTLQAAIDSKNFSENED